MNVLASRGVGHKTTRILGSGTSRCDSENLSRHSSSRESQRLGRMSGSPVETGQAKETCTLKLQPLRMAISVAVCEL